MTNEQESLIDAERLRTTCDVRFLWYIRRYTRLPLNYTRRPISEAVLILQYDRLETATTNSSVRQKVDQVVMNSAAFEFMNFFTNSFRLRIVVYFYPAYYKKSSPDCQALFCLFFGILLASLYCLWSGDAVRIVSTKVVLVESIALMQPLCQRTQLGDDGR
jgi:hypothetical protein